MGTEQISPDSHACFARSTVHRNSIHSRNKTVNAGTIVARNLPASECVSCRGNEMERRAQAARQHAFSK